MAYLGYTEGIKAFKFMCLSNNTIYHSTTMLFDETLFSKWRISKNQLYLQ